MDNDVDTDEEARKYAYGTCIYDLKFALDFIKKNGYYSYVNSNRI